MKNVDQQTLTIPAVKYKIGPLSGDLMKCEIKECNEEIKSTEDGAEFTVSTWSNFGVGDDDDIEVSLCKKHHDESIELLKNFKKGNIKIGE